MQENATTLQCQAGKTQAVLAVLREQIAPILIAQPGLLSLCFLPDEHSHCITVLSAWTQGFSPASVEALPAYRHAIAVLDELLADPGLTPQVYQLQN